MEHEKKYFGGWFVWVFFLLIVASIILTGLSYMGIIGKTVVKRVVFENSFQYSEARKSEIATFNAQLTEISHKLSNPELDKTTRTNLEAQASSVRIMLSVARAKQN